MLAAIDVGSNTLRMLIGEVRNGQVLPHQYFRQITRLGGGYLSGRGLVAESRRRTLEALEGFRRELDRYSIEALRCVGTEALRRAENRAQFLAEVQARTNLYIHVISGDEEALLTSRGALGDILPHPDSFLVIDIGGGSTELALGCGKQILFHCSYPLGVVGLCEEAGTFVQQQKRIDEVLLDPFLCRISELHLEKTLQDADFIGTAGTITALAAMDQELIEYDRKKVANSCLQLSDLLITRELLLPLSSEQRERLPGLEAGRGDLIIPGLNLAISLLQRLGRSSLKVADSGLLEGVILGLCED